MRTITIDTEKSSATQRVLKIGGFRVGEITATGNLRRYVVELEFQHKKHEGEIVMDFAHPGNAMDDDNDEMSFIERQRQPWNWFMPALYRLETTSSGHDQCKGGPATFGKES
ncbi:hypothetical protein VP1G_10228 [Cytospora mali]|uniref:Uncharacterized protein n=1 Tax=Cytospora mali TaxID=578113 RepID=A0A194VGW2_CYTMA|nr:hypothetical protein VP1G_10228 [Valsa mali var. pyri (nom. inval.)]